MGARLAAAWCFLTIVPLPWSAPPGREALAKSAPWFPVVGCIAGALVFVLSDGLAFVLPPSVCAAAALTLLAAVSGGLHLDGLADCADALCSPGRSRDRCLEIIKDSRLGAHGAAALVLLLLVKYACLACLPPARLSFMLLGSVVAGRAALLLPLALLPCIRPQGLAGMFQLPRPRMLAGGACIWALGVMALLLGMGVVRGGVMFLLVQGGWLLVLRRRLGGMNGDCCGAACELGETTFLLAAAAEFGVS